MTSSCATAVRHAGLGVTAAGLLRPDARTSLATRPRVTWRCAAADATGADRRTMRPDVGVLPFDAVVAQHESVPTTQGLTSPQATSVRAWSPPV